MICSQVLYCLRGFVQQNYYSASFISKIPFNVPAWNCWLIRKDMTALCQQLRKICCLKQNNEFLQIFKGAFRQCQYHQYHHWSHHFHILIFHLSIGTLSALFSSHKPTGSSTFFFFLRKVKKKSRPKVFSPCACICAQSLKSYLTLWDSCGSAGKESACNAGDLGWEDPLKKGKAIHSSILAWRIPWTI